MLVVVIQIEQDKPKFWLGQPAHVVYRMMSLAVLFTSILTWDRNNGIKRSKFASKYQSLSLVAKHMNKRLPREASQPQSWLLRAKKTMGSDRHASIYNGETINLL